MLDDNDLIWNRYRPFFEKKANEGVEHKRLRSFLMYYAMVLGYEIINEPLCDGKEPDVIGIKNINGVEFVFLADAKDANNETPSNSETIKRIDGYIETFSRLNLLGDIAIATNTYEAAKDWKIFLEKNCEKHSLNMYNGEKAKFNIKSINEKTYLVVAL